MTNTTKTPATFIVTHGNCVTFHDTRDEAMRVYNGGGCRMVTVRYTDWTSERIA